MNHNELYDLLNALTKEELRKLRTFVDSPLHNRLPALSALLGVLLDVQGRLKTPFPDDDELVQSKLLSKIKTKKDLYKQRSQLIALVELFLRWQLSQSESEHLDLSLARLYQERGLRVRYERLSRKSQSDLPIRDLSVSEKMYWNFSWKKLELEDQKLQSARKHNQHLEKLALSLDRFYLLEKMHLSCEMANRVRVLRSKFNELIPTNSLPLLPHKDNPAYLNLLFDTYELLRRPPESTAIIKYKAAIVAEFGSLQPTEQNTLVSYCINLCIQQLNSGEDQFIDHFLELIMLMKEHDILVYQGQINPWLYKNTVQLMLRRQRTAEARAFWEEYTEHLSPDVRESVSVLAQAQIAFAEDNFEEIFWLTSQMRYLDRHLVIGLKLLASKAYLLLDNRIRLEGELEAFSKYLHYHQEHIGEVRIEQVERFISSVRRINNLSPGDKNGLQQIRETIEQSIGLMAEGPWLIDYIDSKVRPRAPRSPAGR